MGGEGETGKTGQPLHQNRGKRGQGEAHCQLNQQKSNIYENLTPFLGMGRCAHPHPRHSLRGEWALTSVDW